MGFDSLQGKYNFSTPQRLSQPHIQCLTEALSPGIKRPECEADHSPPSSVEVKNGGALLILPLMFSCYGVYINIRTTLLFYFLFAKIEILKYKNLPGRIK
jgi:hypothetical protein